MKKLLSIILVTAMILTSLVSFGTSVSAEETNTVTLTWPHVFDFRTEAGVIKHRRSNGPNSSPTFDNVDESVKITNNATSADKKNWELSVAGDGNYSEDLTAVHPEVQAFVQTIAPEVQYMMVTLKNDSGSSYMKRNFSGGSDYFSLYKDSDGYYTAILPITKGKLLYRNYLGRATHIQLFPFEEFGNGTKETMHIREIAFVKTLDDAYAHAETLLAAGDSNGFYISEKASEKPEAGYAGYTGEVFTIAPQKFTPAYEFAVTSSEFNDSTGHFRSDFKNNSNGTSYYVSEEKSWKLPVTSNATTPIAITGSRTDADARTAFKNALAAGSEDQLKYMVITMKMTPGIVSGYIEGNPSSRIFYPNSSDINQEYFSVITTVNSDTGSLLCSGNEDDVKEQIKYRAVKGSGTFSDGVIWFKKVAFVKDEAEARKYCDNLLFNGETTAYYVNNFTSAPESTDIVRNTVKITVSSADQTQGFISVSRENPTIGAYVTITATPNEGYAFKEWKNAYGEVVSTDAKYTFVATDDTTLTASFYLIPTKFEFWADSQTVNNGEIGHFHADTSKGYDTNQKAYRLSVLKKDGNCWGNTSPVGISASRKDNDEGTAARKEFAAALASDSTYKLGYMVVTMKKTPDITCGSVEGNPKIKVFYPTEFDGFFSVIIPSGDGTFIRSGRDNDRTEQISFRFMDGSTVSKSTEAWFRGVAFVKDEAAAIAYCENLLDAGKSTAYYVSDGAAPEAGDITYSDATIKVVATSAVEAEGSVSISESEPSIGTIVTVTASPNTGYRFNGWTDAVTGELVRTEAEYIFVAAEDVEIVANFIADTVEKELALAVSGNANGKVTVDNVSWGSGDTMYKPGSVEISVEPDTDEGYQFAYWVRETGDASRIFVSEDAKVTVAPLGTLVTYKPEYVNGVTKKTIYIYEQTGKIVAEDPENVPQVPARVGYKGDKWKLKETLYSTNAQGEPNGVSIDIYVPIYVKDAAALTLPMTIIYSDGSTDIDTEVQYNSTLRLTAKSNDPIWTYQYGDAEPVVFSYNKNAEFVYSDSQMRTLTIKETSGGTVGGKAIVYIADTEFNGGAEKAVFKAIFDIPENATLVDHGVLMLKSDSAVSELTRESDGVIVGKVKDNTVDAAHSFIISKTGVTTSDDAKTWYGRAYLIYTDILGAEHVLYGDDIVQNSGIDYTVKE